MQNPSFFSRQVERTAYYILDGAATERGPLAVVCGGRERCRPGYVIQRRTFRYHSIEFVAEGRGEVRLGPRRAALLPGTAFRYGPGLPHRIVTEPSDPMTKYFIDFTGREAAGLVASSLLAEGPVRVSEPHRVRAIFEELHRHAAGGGRHAEALCRLWLRMLPLLIDTLAVRERDAASRSARSFERCMRHLDEHALSLASLEDFARGCRMDPASLCRLFRRHGEGSPYRTLVRRRMHVAARRLQSEDLLVKELAAEMGYSDPFHFSRAFKRVHGISPRRLQELAQRGEHRA